MYFPYLRGKQFELTAIRELSDYCTATYLRPIIEPVRKNIAPLVKTIKQLNSKGITPLIIVNPDVGDFKDDINAVSIMLSEMSEINYLKCVKVSDSSDTVGVDFVKQLSFSKVPYALHITGGIDKGVLKYSNDAELTIVDSASPPLALKRMNNIVLLGDFFKKMSRNSDYGKESTYSHLHVIYDDNPKLIGFGDYTIVAKEFIEGGGPAYVVTLHLSYINDDKFDEMFVRHYSSTEDGTPINPAGKFIEALGKLAVDYDSGKVNFEDTVGLETFRNLHQQGHFPGLGQVKKLSIKHHIETLYRYIEAHTDA